MKFDVVIGNPPYNNDLYLDFVQTGYNLLKDDGVMVQITPAKWQAKGGKKNEDFRANIVPHMKEIVFYPCVQEIFDIRNIDGISIYSVNKNTDYDMKTITNKSSSVKYFNNTLDRCILGQLNNVTIGILNKLSDCKSFTPAIPNFTPFGIKCAGRKTGVTTYQSIDGLSQPLAVMSGDRLTGYCEASDIPINKQYIGKYMLIMNAVGGNCYYDNNGTTLGMNKTYKINNKSVACENYIVLGAFDTEQEVISLDSYINTKFIRFILQTSIVGQGLADIENWRFIPDPGQFDHIFTDDELYKKYNLTQDEINIIESVIKERK